jgi:fused signal recognition particle receptor
MKEALAKPIAEILRRVDKPLRLDPSNKPHVILVAGVNGSGKTTTIGKLAAKYKRDGRKVWLAAGDTFRAAAIEQLKIWADRNGVPIVAKEQGADAAGVAFDALEKARADGADVLMIDTAGRLQNKAGLMAELDKMIRVIKKIDPTAPHATILVLDATTGQNAIGQVEVFRDVAKITGAVMTKLDGTARGGILVSLAEKFDLPIHYIGVGEGIDDLQPFDGESFARAITGADKAEG